MERTHQTEAIKESFLEKVLFHKDSEDMVKLGHTQVGAADILWRKGTTMRKLEVCLEATKSLDWLER